LIANDDRPNADLGAALQEAEIRYRTANPGSMAQHGEALRAMPGGNTRTVLFYTPFPLVWERGEGATLRDVDGHAYTDFLGEYTAGLYGHSDPTIRNAVRDALDHGLVLGGPNRYEVPLAQELCRRFPSLDRVRFCNSGTEANVLALSAARAATGRSAVMVFDGGYHGSVLYFGRGGSPLNLPVPWIKARYNDIDAATALIRQNADDLAAVLVEPMLGSGGCVPADREFLEALRDSCDRHDVALIFDEVMTSRLSPGGLQQTLGIRPDMTTLGKYLGGGLSFGAFGGRAELMDRFDPRRSNALPHAGTFNNNVLSMAAGLAGLTRLFTPEAAMQLNRRGEQLRERLNGLAAGYGVPLQATGIGSLLNLHFRRDSIRSPADFWGEDPQRLTRRADLLALFHFDMIEKGQYLARRGFISLSLPVTDAHLDALCAAVEEFLQTRRSILLSALG
jgi:glutamate-1-semialdehyde 2,1-aminomutase